MRSKRLVIRTITHLRKTTYIGRVIVGSIIL